VQLTLEVAPVLRSIGDLFAIMFAGFLYKSYLRKFRWYSFTARTLFDIVYWVLTPLTFIKSFSATGVTSVLLFPFVALTANLIVAGSIVWRMDFGDGQTKRIVLIHSVNQNNLFIGYPVLYSAFGNATMSLYFGLVAFVYTILVPDIIGNGKPSMRTFLVNPVILGFAFGNVIHYAVPSAAWHVPYLLFWTSNALVYLSIFVMGMQLSFSARVLKGKLRHALYVIGLMRFVLNPLIYVPFIFIFRLPRLFAYESLLLGIMPPATLNTVMALKYKWDPEFASSSTLILTVISLALATGLIIGFNAM